ncbi:MAG: hypothetical protein ABJF23_34805 [Bryobacteraceae bacterium]
MNNPPPDRKKLIGLIAEQEGIRVESGDPVFAVATICQAYLDEAGRRFDSIVTERLADFEEAVAKVQRRAGQLVASEFNDNLAAVRTSLQNDIALAGTRASEIASRVENAQCYPVIVRWTALGMALLIVAFLGGLWIGAHCLR